jgi:hypothetical protein
MDLLQLVLLESPFRLAMLCFLLLAAILLLRRRWTGNARRYSLPILFAGIITLFVVQRAVVTQRERILIACDGFVEAIGREDAGRIAGAIGEGFETEGMDRAAILDYLKSCLEGVDVFDTRFRRRDVTVTGGRAEMLLVAMATVRIRGGAGEYHTCRWRIGWAIERDEWKITSLRPEMVDTVQVDSLQRLHTYVP